MSLLSQILQPDELIGMFQLALTPLSTDLLVAAVELDQLCLHGLWTLDGYRRELASPNSELIVLQQTIASSQPLLGIACLWAILEEAHITLLAVHPDYRGQGLGQALLFTLMVKAWVRKLEWATLEVRASNQAAIALYQKFGFESVGRRRKYYPDTEEDALILWRKGLQEPCFVQVLQTWEAEISNRLRHTGWLLNVSNELSLPQISHLTWRHILQKDISSDRQNCINS